MRIIVIGAGILGSALAWQLARAGAEVTVIEAGQAPAGAATGASFGWINASYHLDEDHFRLRAAGIAAWRSLQEQAGLSEGLDWCGALSWEVQGEDLHEMQARLHDLGYEAVRLSRSEVEIREPALADPPEEALCFPQEGVAEPVAVTRALLHAAQRHGARVIYGMPVRAVRDGAVVTAHGTFDADRIAVCAGTGAAALLDGVGVQIPLLPRPALVLRSAPLPRCLNHVIVTPQGEIRQNSQGRIVMPTAVGHQSDASKDIDGRPDRVADAAAERLRKLLRMDIPPQWADVTLAMRPFPGDGRPVIGACSDEVYATVMHSGITLGAITAELAAAEILGQATNRTEMLAPYRPDRF